MVAPIDGKLASTIGFHVVAMGESPQCGFRSSILRVCLPVLALHMGHGSAAPNPATQHNSCWVVLRQYSCDLTDCCDPLHLV